MARAWIMDMPSVLRNAMAGPTRQARALGWSVSKENFFNWLLAGSQEPSTARKDGNVHTRGSLRGAERQTTKSDAGHVHRSTEKCTQGCPGG